MKNFIYLLLFSLIAPAFSQQLVSQPFIGHTSTSEINGWAMFKKADSVTIRIANHQQKTFYFNKEKSFRQYMPLSFKFSGLDENTNYLVEYAINSQPFQPLINASTKKDTLNDFSFLAGSCVFIGTGFNSILKPVNNLDIFSHMAADSSEFMIWLGDNLYYIIQAHTYKKYLKRNVKTRLNKELAAFLHSKQHYAIWDDHDYGPNNSDGSFKHKAASLEIFNRFWPNPKRDSLASNYYTFTHQDAQFFMCDDRYEGERAAIVLGKNQMLWLKNTLLKSTATFKFICMGMQALNPLSTMECFSLTETECNDLLSFIRENKISGVVFLTGDRHHGELIKIETPGQYPLYDFTTSPLTMYPVNIGKNSPEYNNPYRVPGTLFPHYNYGKVRITGPAEQRTCALELYDKNGQLVWSHLITNGN